VKSLRVLGFKEIERVRENMATSLRVGVAKRKGIQKD
jgi:hypothetical protein